MWVPWKGVFWVLRELMGWSKKWVVTGFFSNTQLWKLTDKAAGGDESQVLLISIINRRLPFISLEIYGIRVKFNQFSFLTGRIDCPRFTYLHSFSLPNGHICLSFACHSCWILHDVHLNPVNDDMMSSFSTNSIFFSLCILLLSKL